MNVPNLITIGRILLVPVIFWLLATGETVAAFAVFVIAGVSDAADGFIAKRYNQQSELGAYLDPIADKFLIVSVFVAMAVIGALPLWLVTVVVSRDVLIVAAVILAKLLNNPMAIRPLFVSKATTTAQLVLAAFVLADQAFALDRRLGALLGGPEVMTGLVFLTGALTALSLAAYLSAWLQHMSGKRRTIEASSPMAPALQPANSNAPVALAEAASAARAPGPAALGIVGGAAGPQSVEQNPGQHVDQAGDRWTPRQTRP